MPDVDVEREPEPVVWAVLLVIMPVPVEEELRVEEVLFPEEVAV